MRIKNYLLIGTLALSLSGAGLASAHPLAAQEGNNHRNYHCHKGPHALRLIPKERQEEFKAFKKALHQQMLPLIKEKRALNMQLTGLLATPGVQWEHISKLVDKINTNHANITTLVAKNKLEAVQKFGIVLPSRPAFHR
ncbi:Uncharacterised protein [Legionella beliardensis]|uniref:Zinc resistance-associated protein n=1 Tax=Legionella beliardensis TaxID=91822 RepID=A0A378I1D8_9GAMM|nr:periplasmic heavy metal sensor [Legionella beliardensis]STX28551.1 Uncharacterised protein [Legionella beliardensis]